MAYAVTPARERPAAVTAAAALLYVTAGLQLASLAVTLATLPAIQQVILDSPELDDSAADAFRSGFTIVKFGVGCFYVLFAAGFAVLGAFVGRGKQGARITTWVLAGIMTICTGCGLFSNGTSSFTSGFAGGMSDSNSQVTIDPADIEAALPAWAAPASTALSVLSFLCLVAIIVLLAVPASNDYFRPAPPAWTPPAYYPPGGMVPGAYPPGTVPPPGAYPPPPGTTPPPGDTNPPTA